MMIDVIAHPGSSQKKIVLKDNIYHVYIHSQPEKGKANEECIKLLSKHFDVSKKDIVIIKGDTQRKKIVEIKNTSG